MGPQGETSQDTHPERPPTSPVIRISQKARTNSQKRRAEKEHLDVTAVGLHAPGSEKSGRQNRVGRGERRLTPGQHGSGKRIERDDESAIKKDARRSEAHHRVPAQHREERRKMRLQASVIGSA